MLTLGLLTGNYFTFQLKVKDKVVCEKIFSGSDYPPNVRYDVDIRKIIPKIEVAIDKFYSTLASFTSSSLNILFKSVKHDFLEKVLN